MEMDLIRHFRKFLHADFIIRPAQQIWLLYLIALQSHFLKFMSQPIPLRKSAEGKIAKIFNCQSLPVTITEKNL